MPVALGASLRGVLKRGSPEAPSSTRDRPTGVRCRKPIAVAEGLTADSPSFAKIGGQIPGVRLLGAEGW
jgi:hypothetical protein